MHLLHVQLLLGLLPLLLVQLQLVLLLVLQLRHVPLLLVRGLVAGLLGLLGAGSRKFYSDFNTVCLLCLSCCLLLV